jgi:DNA phosphorothioation-dependent restriction protein DptG
MRNKHAEHFCKRGVALSEQYASLLHAFEQRDEVRMHADSGDGKGSTQPPMLHRSMIRR